jgi:hypothetical protein
LVRPERHACYQLSAVEGELDADVDGSLVVEGRDLPWDTTVPDTAPSAGEEAILPKSDGLRPAVGERAACRKFLEVKSGVRPPLRNEAGALRSTENEVGAVGSSRA